jgi:hypothetical protein
MMKRLMTCACVFLALHGVGQELYVFSEPASNMPANSIGFVQSAKWLKGIHSGRTEQRHNTELMLGLNKNLMLHAAATFSDMYSPQVRFESVRLYGKYRFLSKDQMFRHFRMAAFAEASYNRNELFYDELGLEGDNSGLQLGVIATQLLHKFAVSGSTSFTSYAGNYVSHTATIHQPFAALNYSASMGYLVFPKDYTDYNQPNLNFYVELLGQKSLDQEKYFVDIAPAIQLIIKSQAKLNIGYRREISGNMHRMSTNSWLVELEWTFLNALKK